MDEKICGCPEGGRNLVVCVDGTSKQFSEKNTNVIELYSKIAKTNDQPTFYRSGIGTYALPSRKSFKYLLKRLDNLVDLAIAWNFENIILEAYRWLLENYKEKDRIFLFGFSRGAYQVRALAGMIHTVGLIENVSHHNVLDAYARYANDTPRSRARRFRTTFNRVNARVHFVGVWDTVSSVGIVRGKSLPLTDSAEHICFFRHALALDERRVKFLPEYVNGGSATTVNTSTVVQTNSNGQPRIKEVWFPGTHSDIGGGNRVNLDLDLGGTPIFWMSFEAASCGLQLQLPRVELPWHKTHNVKESLTHFWWIFEWLPIKRLSYEDSDATTNVWHRGQGRKILSGQKLHPSIAFCPQGYNPKAVLPQQRHWHELVDTGQRVDREWSVAWGDILETDVFDHTIVPGIVDKLKSESQGHKTVWALRLTVITSTNEGQEVLLGVPNVMHDLVQILETAEPQTQECVIKVLEDLETFLYGESSEISADDLEEAIAYHKEALIIRIGDHPGRCSSLDSLAMYLQARFNKCSNQKDLDDAIEYYREILVLRPSGHSEYSMSLTNLANAVFARYEYSRSVDDLNEAIKFHDEAAASRRSGHPGHYNNLAKALQARFNRLGDLDDLQKAIEYHREALDLRPPNHPGRPRALNKLADALLAHYEQSSKMGDLDEAIECSRDVLELRPPGHLGRSSALNNLAAATLARFEQLGRMEDLTAAITFYREALVLQTPGPSYRPFPLSNLASALLALYEGSGDMKDLKEAIEQHISSLSRYSPDHPGYINSLNNPANGLYLRYMRLGSSEDLDQAIKDYSEVLELCPRGQLDRPSCLNNLANALLTRHKQSSSEEDLNDAIKHHREALGICHPGHVGRPNCHRNLAISLISYFDLFDSMGDLEEAISHLREALALRPLGPSRFSSLDHLANAIFTRFKKLHEMGDVEQAIELYREALDICPPDHVGRSKFLQNLAISLISHFDLSDSMDNLEEAIIHLREALALRPLDPGRIISLDLANAIFIRFKKLREIGDLEQAIEFYREALSLRPRGHPARMEPLNNLAFALVDRYNQLHSNDDLNEVVPYIEEVIELCPHDQANLLRVFIDLHRGDLLQSFHDNLSVMMQQIDPLPAS